MFFVVPHGQLGHFPPGQFPPHVSAKLMAKIKANKKRVFIRLEKLNL
jgi:hypothetical protein